MKKDVKDMFEQITMPEECVQKIRCAMMERRKPKRRYSQMAGRSVSAMAAMLALVLLISPAARAAVNDLVVKYFWSDSDMTIYEELNENGEVVHITAVDTEAPPFARIVNGRLYFLGNGEKIDITDQITEEEPFYYTYQDDYSLTHYMAVGYSGAIENFGIYEFIKEEKSGQEEWEGWVTGTGRNFINPETEAAYPWVATVWEDLDIPWPMPGE